MRQQQGGILLPKPIRLLTTSVTAGSMQQQHTQQQPPQPPQPPKPQPRGQRPPIILLTGQPGVGKTTLCRKVCDSLTQDHGASVVGFVTEERRVAGKGRVGFDVVSINASIHDATRMQARLLVSLLSLAAQALVCLFPLFASFILVQPLRGYA